MPCLSESDLNRYHAGEMDAAQTERVRDHLAACQDCNRRDTSLVAEHEDLLHRVRALGGTVDLSATRPSDNSQSRIAGGDRAGGRRLQAGDAIGPYNLLQPLGEGGFGVVYLAEQREPIRRRVALKILKPGMDSQRVIARFKAEEQALALMDHPNVARVFDAGTTEPSGGSLPYFAMEYVAGVPITDYCDRHTLSTTQRLELFMAVCDAVQHAHQKGIIHRDLKPSNVLVTVQGDWAVPKVIDFGVASDRGGHDGVLSADGRYVAFTSFAANLATDDLNLLSDVFVHDRQTGIAEAVSVGPHGATGNRNSYYPSLSHDGRLVAFASDSTDLVSGDTNHEVDIFVHARVKGQGLGTAIPVQPSASIAGCHQQIWQTSHPRTSRKSAISLR